MINILLGEATWGAAAASKREVSTLSLSLFELSSFCDRSRDTVYAGRQCDQHTPCRCDLSPKKAARSTGGCGIHTSGWTIVWHGGGGVPIRIGEQINACIVLSSPLASKKRNFVGARSWGRSRDQNDAER